MRLALTVSRLARPWLQGRTCLQQVRGVSGVSVYTVLALLPELGRLSADSPYSSRPKRRAAVSFSRNSGERRRQLSSLISSDPIMSSW